MQDSSLDAKRVSAGVYALPGQKYRSGLRVRMADMISSQSMSVEKGCDARRGDQRLKISAMILARSCVAGKKQNMKRAWVAWCKQAIL